VRVKKDGMRAPEKQKDKKEISFFVSDAHYF
jgi:hypothetical protein